MTMLIFGYFEATRPYLDWCIK